MADILAYVSKGLADYYKLLTGLSLQDDKAVLRLTLALGGITLARLSYGSVKSVRELESIANEIQLFKLFYDVLGVDPRNFQEAVRIVNNVVAKHEPFEKLYYVVRGRTVRKRLGAFFTERNTAKMMVSMAVERVEVNDSVKSVFDPTVGGGTLLAVSLEAFSKNGALPNVQLRGVDIDPAALFLAYANIAYTAWKIDKAIDVVSWINKSLRLSWNDYILRYRVGGRLAPIASVDDLNMSFDIVIANPPWVHVNIYGREKSRKYLSRIPRDLMRTLSEVYRGTRYKIRWPEISRSQPPIALVFLYYMLRQFSKVATILVTGTILKSWNTAGFRQWLAENFSINIVEIYCRDMEGTTSWPVILEATHKLDNRLNNEYMEYRVIMCRNSVKTALDLVLERELVSPLTYPFAVGPWATPLVSNDVLKDIVKATHELDRIGELYQIYRGVNTNAAEVFVFKSIRKVNEELVQATSLSGKVVTLESELLHVFVRGANLHSLSKGGYEYILLPHDIRTMRPLTEEEFKTDYPYAYRWLSGYRKLLERRSRNPKPWFRIMDISVNKMKGVRIAWRKHSILLSFMAIPERVNTPIGEKLVVPDGTVYFIRAESAEVPNLDSLNHRVIKVLAWMTAKPKGEFPYREYYSWHVALLPYEKTTCVLDEVYEKHRAEIDNVIKTLISRF